MMPLRFLSRIKERGQAHFLFFAIIPQQRVGTGKLRILQLQKFGFRHSVSGDNFYSLGPIRKPPFLRGKWAKINPPVKNWLFCEKTGKLKMADLLWKLEDLAGSRSGIRCCGLPFCWASLGDPASFIPLNRNFQQIGRFSFIEWVRALPVLRSAASRARCLPLPKEEFLWHAPRRSRTPRKNQLACFCETCDACETGSAYCTVTILPLCTSRPEKVTPKSDKGWRQRFSFCFSTFAVMENPEAA